MFLSVMLIKQEALSSVVLHKTKVSINWKTVEGRILIHCAVGTAAVCNQLY